MNIPIHWKGFATVSLLAAVLAVGCATPGPPRQAGPPIEPVREHAAFGKIAVAHPAYRIELLGPDRMPTIENIKECDLATGRYLLTSYVVQAKDAEGQTWSVSGVDTGVAVEVRRGATSELKFGPPFKAQLVSHKVGSGLYEFQIKMVGAGGEPCSPKSIQRGSEAAAAPGIEFRDASGKVVARGNFKYG